MIFFYIVSSFSKKLKFFWWVYSVISLWFPWSRKWQPTPVFLPGTFHGQRGAWWATVHGVAESDTTEHSCIVVLFFIFFLAYVGHLSNVYWPFKYPLLWINCWILLFLFCWTVCLFLIDLWGILYTFCIKGSCQFCILASHHVAGDPVLLFERIAFLVAVSSWHKFRWLCMWGSLGWL